MGRCYGGRGRNRPSWRILSRGDTGGAVVWGVDVGVVGANGAEYRGSSCGVPETGEKVEGKKAKEGFMRKLAANKLLQRAGLQQLQT